MKNHNDEAMASYFSSMLNPGKPLELAVEPLTEVLDVGGSTLPKNLVFSEPEVQVEQQAEDSKLQPAWKNLSVENEFQALFFELSGIIFAVPLADLGGIHHLDDSINVLFGKPAWFSGVMTHNQSLFNIVDTAQWINTGKSAQTLNYTHYILLGETQWGLSCEKLIGTETLSRSQIKWRETPGKQAWIAGTVKEKMCSLIHAEELVKLLNNE